MEYSIFSIRSQKRGCFNKKVNPVYSLYIALVSLALSGCLKDAEKEHFYMHKGFNGPVIVLFDQKDGQSKKYDKDTRIYQIPENGILYTQFERVTGNLSQSFYYKDSSQKDPIPTLFIPINASSKHDSTGTYVFRFMDGRLGTTKYVSFFVGPLSKSDSFFKARDRMIDRIQEAYPDQIK